MRDAAEHRVDTSFLRLLPSLIVRRCHKANRFHYVTVYLLTLLMGGYGQIYDALTGGSNNENVKVCV